MKEPYRLHDCWGCKLRWLAKVKLGRTTNLTGEMSQFCPKCGKKSSCASPWKDERGNDFKEADFKEIEDNV